MRSRTLSLLALLSASLLLTACKGEKGDPGPSGIATTGNIFGFVRTLDEFGAQLPKNGVTVTLENTSPAITAVTNNDGRFELPNVPGGTYNVAYTKAGFGAYKRFGFPHIGGNQPNNLYDTYLNQVSTSTLTDLAVRSSTSGSSSLEFDLNLSNNSTTGRRFGTLLFVGATSAVTAATGEVVDDYPYYNQNIPAGSRTVNLPMRMGTYASELNALGYTSGSTAYVVAYPAPANYYYSSYQDPVTGRPVYTALGAPSNVVRITVP